MPYSHTNSKGQTYFLHGKEVVLQNGRRQRIYYFAREAKAEALDALPAGGQVVENPRTGLPFLKGARAAPAVDEPTKRPAARGAKRERGAQRAPTSW